MELVPQLKEPNQPNVRRLQDGSYRPVTASDLKRRVGARGQQSNLLYHPKFPGLDLENRTKWPHVYDA